MGTITSLKNGRGGYDFVHLGADGAVLRNYCR